MRRAPIGPCTILLAAALGVHAQETPPSPTPTPTATPESSAQEKTDEKKVAIPFRPIESNVIINLPSVGDNRFAGGATAEVETHLHGIERQLLAVTERVGRGTLRNPE